MYVLVWYKATCLLRWGPLNPPTRWAFGATIFIMTNPIFPMTSHGNSSIPQRMRRTSSITANPPKRKQPLNFALVNAAGIRCLLIISKRQWTQISSLCTERANPLRLPSSFNKILVERWYSSVLLIWCLHLTVRLLQTPLPIGFRTCWLGSIYSKRDTKQTLEIMD